MSCIICDSLDFSPITYPGSQNPLNFSTIRVCRSCAHGQVDTHLTDQNISDFYERGNYWQEVVASKSLEVHHLTQSEERIQRVLRFAKLKNMNESVLDFGAGYGFLYDSLVSNSHTSSCSYYYYEPDLKLKKIFISRTSQIENCLTLEQVKARSYQYIFLNHVLEHVIDPQKLLAQLESLLSPGGILYVEVPHLDYRFKSDVFPHVQFFSKSSIKKLKRSSTSIIATECFGSNKSVNFLNQIYSMCTKAGFTFIAKKINKIIWRYKFITNDGPWLFLLLKNESR